jgi:hypothetical protein
MPRVPISYFLCSIALALSACSGGVGESSSGLPVPTNVVTYKNDQARTGQNLTETLLTPWNVNAQLFGLKRILAVDGKVDAQPLYLSHLSTAGGTHNVVFVATEHDSVYAFDADTGMPIWQVSLLGVGESPSYPGGCNQTVPEIGITGTPVIDTNAGTYGAIYVVAVSTDDSSNQHQRLHALDVATGAELLGGPTEISASYTAANGTTVTFDPAGYQERAALLLTGETIYTSWSSHCDSGNYTGWVIAYNGQTLMRTAALNVGPNSGGVSPPMWGPAIWMSGGGPAADSAGNIYLLTANGAFETTLDSNGFPSLQDYGNSFLKIASGSGGLAVSDYFTVSDSLYATSIDKDLGSGGAILLPDMTDASNAVRHLAVGAGKDGNMYVVDRDSMGKFDPNTNEIWQELDGALPGGVWSTPAYFNGNLYYCDNGGTLKAFAITKGRISVRPSSQSRIGFLYPGTAPSVSANGTGNGIVWAHENQAHAVLHAYDATNLAHELYNSEQASGGRDEFGTGNKFVTPVVADGKVFVATTTGVAVFGLLK